MDVKTQRQQMQLVHMMKRFCVLFIEIERMHQHMARKDASLYAQVGDIQNCTPAEIKAAIRGAGTSQAAIAAYLNLSVANVSQVVNGKGRSQTVEAELAKIIGRFPFGPPAGVGRVKTTWNGKAQAVAA